MQKTRGVGSSDLACQKSRTWRSCVPYETFAAVGVTAGTGSFFSSLFSTFFSSFFSCAFPLPSEIRAAVRAHAIVGERSRRAVMLLSCVRVGSSGEWRDGWSPRPYHRTLAPATVTFRRATTRNIAGWRPGCWWANVNVREGEAAGFDSEGGGG